MVSESTWRVHGECAYENKVFVNRISILARNHNGLGEYMDWTWSVHDLFWFILTRNYNGFVVDMDSLDQANLHFSEELQWFRGGHGFCTSSERSF